VRTIHTEKRKTGKDQKPNLQKDRGEYTGPVAQNRKLKITLQDIWGERYRVEKKLSEHERSTGGKIGKFSPEHPVRKSLMTGFPKKMNGVT
jgi:hypothetical protein